MAVTLLTELLVFRDRGCHVTTQYSPRLHLGERQRNKEAINHKGNSLDERRSHFEVDFYIGRLRRESMPPIGHRNSLQAMLTSGL
jgi:hypothetical protein